VVILDMNGMEVIAKSLNLNTLDMLRYPYECPVGYKPSRDANLRGHLVPIDGALSHVEGLALYSLIRAIGAKRIVELGTFAGHSTNYLAAAARETGGIVDTVDNVWYWGGVIRGQAITLSNRRVVRQHKSDAYKYLLNKCEDNLVDFIFEDTSHTWRDTYRIIALACRKLRSGGILAIHDVAVCREVREAVEYSGLNFLSIAAWPSEFGLALWRKP